MTFTAPDERRQQIALAAGEFPHHQVHYLGIIVAHHLRTRFRRYCPGALGVQKAQEVVNFRDGANRGTGIVSGGFLFYGNDGAKAAYLLNLWLFQYTHEVLGIGGKRIHIAALALCVNGVERQGTLAAAAEARHHHKLPAGDVYVNVLQVICPRAAYLYIIICHRITKVQRNCDNPAAKSSPAYSRFADFFVSLQKIIQR